MRILILDDEAIRHELLDARWRENNELVHVWSVDDAVAALVAGEPFDLALLDHDLGYMVPDGTDFARRLTTEVPEDRRPARVVVHSWNPDGARRMVRMCKEVGMRAYYEPFTR